MGAGFLVPFDHGNDEAGAVVDPPGMVDLVIQRPDGIFTDLIPIQIDFFAGKVGRFEAGLLAHLRSKHADLMKDITENDRKVKDELEDKIKAAIESFAADFA